MKAWLYDEDRFPSGYAGGMLTKDNPEYALRVLEMEELPYAELKKEEDIVKAYLYRGEGNFEQIDDPEVLDTTKIEQDAVIFRIKRISRHPGFDDQPYTDLCNKEAVDKFIEITYEAYKKTVGQYFGTVIPGVFTDEPHFNPGGLGKARLPWPANFDDEFTKKKGYDIFDHLPELFFNTGNYRKVRFDFWDVLLSMFVEAFTKTYTSGVRKTILNLQGIFGNTFFPTRYITEV